MSTDGRLSTTAAAVIVSAVFAVDGDEGYLFAAVQSVLQQTLPQVEAIVVTGPVGSVSHAVATRLHELDERVQVLPQHHGMSRGAARNAGLSAARGRYVAFPETDGLVPAGAYAEAAASLEASGSDIVCGPVVAYGARRGNVHNVGVIPDRVVHRAALSDMPTVIGDDAVWNKVFRASFLADRGLAFDVDSRYADRLFGLRTLVAASAIDIVQNAVAWQRIHPEDSTSPAADWCDFVAACLDAVDACPVGVVAAFAESLITGAFVDAVFLRHAAVRGFADRVAPLAARALSLVPPAALAALTIDRRWALALVIAGDAATAAKIFDGRFFPHRDDLAVVDLDGTPPVLRGLLGLGARDVTEAFRARFVNEPAPVADDASGRAADVPDISVIIPTFNVASYVDELLATIRAARDVTLEVIVVDDGSTDATCERVAAHAAVDDRVRLFHSTGAGGGQARNYGIELARGEYLAFADGDDLVPPAAYATMLHAARETGAEVVSASYLKFFPTSTWNAVDGYSHAYRRRVDDVRLTQHPQLSRHRACWNRLFRRDFWLRNAFPFPGVPRANDIVAVLSVLSCAQHITVVPDVAYIYRDRPGSGSMTSAIGTGGYTVSYFAEEETCSRMLAQVGDEAIDREYWAMVLGTDGWGNLLKYLVAQEHAGFDQGETIAAQAERMLGYAPERVIARLTPEQQVIWHLIAAGEWPHAARLARRLMGDETVPLGDLVAAVARAADIPGLAARAIGWVAWKFILRRVVDDPESRTREDLDAVVALFFDRLPAHGVTVPVLPTALEYRMWRVLAQDARAVERALSSTPQTVDMSLADGTPRVTVAGRTAPGVEVGRLVAVAGSGDSEKYPLAVVRRAAGDDWPATLDIDAIPAPGQWRLRFEYDDEWGTAARAAVRVRVVKPNPVLHRLGRIAPVLSQPQKISIRLSVAMRVKRKLGR